MKLPSWASPIIYILVIIVIAIPVLVVRNVGKLQAVVHHQDFPCSKSLRIDITSGSQIQGGIVKDNVTYNQSDIFYSENRTWGCICNIKKCVRKCCAQDEVMDEDHKCQKDFTSSLNVTFYEETNPTSDVRLKDFFMVFGRNCINHSSSKFISYIEEDIYLQANGTLMWMPEDNNQTQIFHNPDSYCVEEMDGEGIAILCNYYKNSEETKAIVDLIIPIGMMISIPFLFVTFLFYAISPDSSLHRKALMFYVLALLVTYVLLVVICLDSQLHQNAVACHLVGYLIIFFFTASFLWMNVMCIDMWLTFSGIKGFNGHQTGENTRFIIYCLYAWGLPLVHFLIIFLINTYGEIDSAYHPNIGRWRCFIEGGTSKFIFYYSPLTIIIIINIVLFILTIIRIRRVKNETVMLKRTDSRRNCYKKDKQKFNLYMKLMFVMGINWLMELISSVVTDETKKRDDWFFLLMDFMNSLYGVIIFFIFVFKKESWIALKRRYYILIGKPHLAHIESINRSTRTTTSNVSSPETEGYRMGRMGG